MAEGEQDWVSEHDLAAQLNVRRDVLKAERPYLQAGEVDQRSGVIVWLKKAAERISAKLGIEIPEKTAPTPASAAPEPPTDELLTVFSQPAGAGGYHFPNPRVIKAKRANGEVVVVSVMDSRKYMTKLVGGLPMTFRARKSAEGSVWRLTGREPRYPGRW